MIVEKLLLCMVYAKQDSESVMEATGTILNC